MQMENNSLVELYKKYSCPALKELSEVYPVPVGKICASLGIEALYSSMEDNFCGKILLGDDQKYYIHVNESHIPTRKRFTVAHELGHYCYDKELLDRERVILERSNNYFQAVDAIEVKANQFAAELLMPQKHFLKQYSNLKATELLAKYFFVSELAIKIRLINLGLSLG
jgi:Zn-dependent peptidase ImmA (M78 family)